MTSNTRLTDILIMALLSIGGMLVAVELLGETRLAVDAFEVAASINFLLRGETVIHLPPLGEITAQTHWLPFQVNLTFLNVDLDMLSRNLENTSGVEAWEESIIYEARRAAAWFVAKNIAVAFAGGGIVAYFLGPARIKGRFWKGGTLGTVLLVVIIVFTIVIPFNVAAFESPQYHGVISAAPWAMNLFNEGLAAIQNASRQLQAIGGNLDYLFDGLEKVSNQQTDTDEALKVMHVSDIHNNPAAVDFMGEVVKAFGVDMVVDTGDITDYGYPLEAELVSGVAELGVPYVLTPGNHDSPQVYNLLEEEGVIVLNNKIKEVNGLVIAGIKDPAAETHFEVTTTEEEMEKYAEDEVKGMFYGEDRPGPDLIAVHDAALGEKFTSQAPLILHGHTHNPGIREKEGTVIINAGTTGASGIRGVERLEDEYTMYILYFSDSDESEERLRLSAADFISVPQVPGGFNLERRYFHKEER